MLGLYGLYTPIGPEVGVNRSMTLNPKIETTRGFMRKDFNLDDTDGTNLFSIGELLNVFTPKHGDAPRSIMATVQGKHITPTKNQSPYIVGNGSDLALAHIIGSDFAKKATEDGVIKSIDPKSELMVIEYKDGTKSIVNLKATPAKNGGGGFYTANKLDLVKGIKVGTKVKKGQIVAIDRNFFKETLDGSIGFASGKLTKIAVIAMPETFEDSCIITQKVVDDLSSEIIGERKVILNKTSRVINTVNIGDKVGVHDPLMVFEDIGDNDEASILKDLSRLDKTSQDFVNEYARSVAKAKYSGVVFDIQVYYNCELEEMHPTLRAFVEKYKKNNSVKAKIIESGRSDEIVKLPSVEKIESTKILGNEVDGVLIQFFIKYTDKFKVGDKCCFSIALKTIVAETVEEGKEPYSEYDPDENVDAILSPLSLVSRMVPDFNLVGFSTKVVIELEKQCIKLLKE